MFVPLQSIPVATRKRKLEKDISTSSSSKEEPPEKIANRTKIFGDSIEVDKTSELPKKKENETIILDDSFDSETSAKPRVRLEFYLCC